MNNDLTDTLSSMYTCISGLFDKAELHKGNIKYLNSKLNTISSTILLLDGVDTSALNTAFDADVWAEGSDADIALKGGEHSAKGWAMIALSAINVITGYMQTADALADTLDTLDTIDARGTRY